jgi:pyruvate dehydrogenase E2 component (dihydrolipoamide acetyltransferase)
MSLFRMPSLGADMEDGTLVEWLKQPGERVDRGDIVAVVETQKGAIEIEIFEDGTLAEHLVAIGETVPVGTPIARLAGAGEDAERIAAQPPPEPAPAAPAPPPMQAPAPAAQPRTPPPEPTTPEPATPEPAAPEPAAPEPSAASGARPKASPAARRAAERGGVALAGLTGTGPEGAIVLRDVEGGAPAPAAPSKPATPGHLDLGEMRKAIAAAMARSKREIPHYYLAHDIDLGAALDWMTATNAERSVTERLLIGVLLLKAVALAVREIPEFNGTYDAEGFHPATGIHVGSATAIRGGGLVAPAIRDTDRLAVDDLMTRLRDVTARARAGRLRSSELAGATITVSSLGERGVHSLFGVIHPPQVALIGFGRVTERPWVVDGAVVARPVISATLAADHRVSDGHRGGLLLAAIDRLLQKPEAL